MPGILYFNGHRECENHTENGRTSFSCHSLHDGETFDLWCKDEYLFIFMLRGEIEMLYNDGENITLESNMMYSLGYSEKLMGFCNKEALFVMLSFDEPKIKCGEFSLINLKKYITGEQSRISRLPINEMLMFFIEGVRTYLDTGICCKHWQDIKQSEWLYIMRAFYTNEENAMFMATLIMGHDEFRTMVLNNYKRASSVEELAAICNMTTKTLTRRFKKTFNDTPKQWLLKQKKKEVYLHLLRSQSGLKTVSNELGFYSPSHLSAYCKKQFQKTLSEIKRSNKE